MVATQVGAGLTDLKTGGLILGLGVGQATSAVSLVKGSALLSDQARDGREWRRLRQLARRYRRFPLVLAPSGVLNVMGLQLPVVLIAYWYGSSVAGWMGLTQRVLSLPVMLVGTAIAQVFPASRSRRVPARRWRRSSPVARCYWAGSCARASWTSCHRSSTF